MKLVVGLGNPGAKYRDTRHNVGYLVAALLSQQTGGEKPKNKFDAEIVEVGLEGDRVILLCPLTYMNLSGKSVLAARDFYKLDAESILVVADDFHLPLGRIRIRPEGSAGGQKGLQDIINRLGTQQIPRLRLGIGPVPGNWDPADFVLGKFAKQEQEELQLMVADAAEAVRVWCREGVQAAMNRFNGGKAESKKSEGSKTTEGKRAAGSKSDSESGSGGGEATRPPSGQDPTG